MADFSTDDATPPPGWYLDTWGQQRWWDGQAWGAYALPAASPPASGWGPKYANAPVVPGQVTPWLTSNERTLALLSHLGRLFGGFLVPLIIMLTAGKESAFVRDQAVEALNFDLTVLIALVCCIPLVLVLIGLLLLPILIIGSIVMAVVAAMKANQGVAYRYPLTIRFVH